jgi:hypothetical protein
MKDQQIAALLEALEKTRDQEIDCEEFLAQMPSYAELRAAGRPVLSPPAAAVAHERLCANCREECAALIDAISAA